MRSRVFRDRRCWLPLLGLALIVSGSTCLSAQNSVAPSGPACCAFLGLSGSVSPAQPGTLSGGVGLDFTLQDAFTSGQFGSLPLLRFDLSRLSGHYGGDMEFGILAPLALARVANHHPGFYIYPEATAGVRFGAPYRLYGQGGVGAQVWLGNIAPFAEARWRQPFWGHAGFSELVVGIRFAVWD